ncbi:MAG: aldehyde dehydrogenase family protein [Planctomycetaceae bacterium]|nr:aldehyde dehydrogenase family protein [Planctomycetaceae bacterium]
MQAKLFIGGRWLGSCQLDLITNKYTGEVIGEIPKATPDEVEAAIAAADQAAPVMADLPAYQRAKILLKTAQILSSNQEEVANLIALEAGKAIVFARAEVDRAVCALTIASEEAKRIGGEVVPLDAVPAGEGFFGMWQRRPIGIVGAITPFNFPLNLVVHKLAPAIAAGNTVVLKPAEQTPLTAVKLCEYFAEAGLPDGAINLVHGDGPTVGSQIVTDPRVRKISFTGSRAVGQEIISRAGVKKVTLELGNTSPVVVARDANLDLVANRCAFGAFYYSGQVCISTQRIYAEKAIMETLKEKLIKETESLKVGNPLDEQVTVGPMIHEDEAKRVQNCVEQAVSDGARILTGGQRKNATYWPTVLDNVNGSMDVVSKEIFGPVVSLIETESFEESLALADATQYGLQASIFTKDIDQMFQAIKRLDFGGIVVNEIPAFRADHMPYGGNRQSGLGREGIRFAIEEMTNIQMISIKLGTSS